ncbi:MAG: KOW domain-containing RNA-binding protein [Lachnospiraceae bacterium]|nr:KOW domain-containing RNA-binding protein [Lachnospiraceae bacterium]
MKVWTSRMLAVSLAGHDKGNLFVILEEPSASMRGEGVPSGQPERSGLRQNDGDYYLLADGKSRTLEHPKRKKAKHVQEITHLPDEILAQMQEITLDAHVRSIVKEYQKYQS